MSASFSCSLSPLLATSRQTLETISMKSREQLGQSRRWVVKVGSSLLTNEGRGLDRVLMAQWVEQIAALRGEGVEVVLVSSGAVSEGVKRLGWARRPQALHELQAAAAVGQMGLIEAYENCFQRFGLHTAQVLLTHDDLADRRRYLNARSTLRTPARAERGADRQ
jgi:glutamate 5-kinase